jgi:hypothetical protein
VYAVTLLHSNGEHYERNSRLAAPWRSSGVDAGDNYVNIEMHSSVIS